MIEVNNLNKSFSDIPVLKEISFCIAEGTLAALLGPNGAGKSTLIKSVLGVINPDQHGLMKIGNQIRSRGIANSEDIPGYMPQSPAFPRHLSVNEVIDFFESLNQTEPMQKESLISEMKMSDFMHKKINSLSQGMKQKVNILQCFMFDHSVFILDEPTSSLDPDMAYYLKNLLLQKKKEKKTILFTSHIMSEVEELADEMLILLDGRIILQDSPRNTIKRQRSKNLEEAIRTYWSRS